MDALRVIDMKRCRRDFAKKKKNKILVFIHEKIIKKKKKRVAKCAKNLPFLALDIPSFDLLSTYRKKEI